MNSISADRIKIICKIMKNYILTLGVVNSMSDLVLSSDGTVKSVQNVVVHNFDNATLLEISRDTEVTTPVNIAFLPAP